MATVGRPPVLDEDKKRDVIAILTVGCRRTTAARYVGCHVTTIQRTAERDPEFALRLRQAESTHEILHLKNINSAAKDARYWRAAAWALERTYPDRYAQRRPDVVTAEQITQLLAQLADIVVDEVPDPAFRQRILLRLSNLLASLPTTSSNAAPSDDD